MHTEEVYAVVVEWISANYTLTSLDDACPTRSSKGSNYHMIVYVFDCNTIVVAEMLSWINHHIEENSGRTVVIYGRIFLTSGMHERLYLRPDPSMKRLFVSLCFKPGLNIL
jgi:hypothetical protein